MGKVGLGDTNAFRNAYKVSVVLTAFVILKLEKKWQNDAAIVLNSAVRGKKKEVCWDLRV